MKIFIFLFLIFSFLIPVQAADLKTNYLTFRLGARSVKLKHFENSNDSGFTSLQKESSFPVLSLSVGAEKEILADQFVSFTFGIIGIGMFGRKKEELTKQNLIYRDTASGYGAKAYGSLNGNFKIGKMRSQAFGGFYAEKNRSRYVLAYQPMSSSTPDIRIVYNEDATYTGLSTGVRFFDDRLNIFSIIEFSYDLSSVSNIEKNKFFMNKKILSLGNYATSDHPPYSVALGFGMMF